MKKIVILFILVIVMTGCPWYGYKYNTGKFPDYPVNLSDVNSEYDDYNLTAPYIFYRNLFHFSSNRKSEGGTFDIIGEDLYIHWNKDQGTLSVGTGDFEETFDEYWFYERYGFLGQMFDSINTPFNELGPYSIGYRDEISYSKVLWTDLLMWATDEAGDYDIKYICAEMGYTSDTTVNTLTEVGTVPFLDLNANELYPSFYGEGFYCCDEWGLDIGKIESILFCSDQSGDYDIYEVALPSFNDWQDLFQTDPGTNPDALSLNSQANDKCPFVNGRLLVFASDREGGFGGYDLYYSLHDEEGWGSPKNFGEKINTEYDEYRPITIRLYDFENTLMIFSSDRPGGKGGFDLYYVGIRQSVT
ncbi:MAG: PD40 domain-containing protein [Bacteroidales bacterium]|nr:PD40 domain-containing protein [Bacteroidales bacterium]